jgi:hypothetical protein
MAAASSTYGWIITEDYTDDRLEIVGKTVIGPYGVRNRTVQRLRNGEGIEFRMKDDDGQACYKGRFLGDADSEDAFAPLDDYGTPDGGATSIEYLRDGVWEIL